MEFVYFAVVAVVIYFVSDRFLRGLEARRGRPFERRSLVFGSILLVLALITFNAIRILPLPFK
ncbi:MAG: hypothetical protein HOL85_13890 [Rhodospirillaceae bacterium]|nr:hypothetical protein [Rhodospirillaceae bacterium]MBT6137585.1 hypothetical protein [Rhodospirillaceae bacterium]